MEKSSPQLNTNDTDVFNKVLTVGIVVGEHSGDTLGEGLMTEILARYPNTKFVGIGGPKMKAKNFESLFDMEELAVMGIFEVLGRLRRLFKVKKELVTYFESNKPDIFVGIDAPDFNLRLEQSLKDIGIKTVHYVSPSVWAWRQKRIFKIESATNLVLALLPFEKAFYDKFDVPCKFVGHSLADDIPLESDKESARKKLSLPLDKKILALMPGSRGGELSRLAEPFIRSAEVLLSEDKDLQLIVPMISDKRALQFKGLLEQYSPKLPVKVIVNDTQTVMAAADCLLTASGTVTLEAALIKRPMVITYRFNPLTYHMFKGFVNVKWFSLPNLLADKSLVPELLQSDVTVENIVPLLKERLYQDQSSLNEEFLNIHKQLKLNASQTAATAVLELATNK